MFTWAALEKVSSAGPEMVSGRILRQETMDRQREFFCSDDPLAPGNWFFGPSAVGTPPPPHRP